MIMRMARQRVQVARLARQFGPSIGAVRSFTVGEKLDQKGKAIENKYFAELENHLVEEYRSNMDKQEDLKALIDILGPNHGLSRQTIHKLCMWKHEGEGKTN